MTDNTPQNEMTDQQRSEWVREQFQKANKHLAENGVLFESVVTNESRYLVPYLAVWKIKDTNNAMYWVMSGDLPTDYIAESTAATARDAIKHFAMAWQLKAANLRESDSADSSSLEYAELLESRAEGLHAIQNQDELWQGV
ncbi:MULTISPECIES: DUF4826 family protein [Alteromonas]|jgi:hypothetical protein|uniref:DUF4826 family protein n=2 Tax=Alteromonas TaxID=226 RepID=A0AAW7YWF2_9ALTE|nr:MULTISPECIES: DUF4826 family protein [Alteromonas]AEF03469.1 hypothetical protein ambt_09715 [Alteromonas naphthalenivorans]MDO6575765.1 DUF4826 family protein [Alteromonas stellipolaris]MDP2596172.1 DUF4826 family protein [Alteromonas stellipolaris]PHS54927.1 MAG: DUF4826 domain-containing protein [Alteromonas sp.]